VPFSKYCFIFGCLGDGQIPDSHTDSKQNSNLQNDTEKTAAILMCNTGQAERARLIFVLQWI
jgi:hypothetical protein